MLICQKNLIYMVKKPLTHEIWQRKFGRVKGALFCSYLGEDTLSFKRECLSVAFNCFSAMVMGGGGA